MVQLNVWDKGERSYGRSGTMPQEIICKKGKCSEDGTIDSKLNSVFNTGNIIDQIQFDLLKEMVR